MPEVRVESLIEGAGRATGTVLVIDVLRAFTCAAVAFARGAQRIIMVDAVERALELKRAGAGELCMGERRGRRPDGFDFPNSPAMLERADLRGRTLIQATSNGTAGLAAARGAERLFATALVNARATAEAVVRGQPQLVTLVAMGQYGTRRADEDELCALYIRALLAGRQPNPAALRELLASLLPPVPDDLVAAGDYDPRDREIALRVDALGGAIEVTRENDLLIAEPAR